MRVAYFCFFTAVFAGLAGMSLGDFMGAAEDFTLNPAHAQANLLGWVTMAIYGLYHLSGSGREGRLVWVQAASGAIGFVLTSGGLGPYLSTHDPRFLPLAFGGAIFSTLGLALFGAVVARDARRGARSDRRAAGGARPA